MRRNERKLAVVLAVCSTVGLILALTTPALAHKPTTNVMEGFPNEDNGNGHSGFGGAAHGPDTGSPVSSESETVADALDTGANFSAVTDPSATAYGWIGCVQGTGDPTTSTPGGACDVFGVDTAAKAGMMPVGAPATNYWRLQTKIPVDYEGGPWDFYGVGCASDGNPATQPTDLNHCTLDVGTGQGCAAGGGTCLDNMHFDHTAITTDHAATTTGRIESVQAGGTTCNTVGAHGCALPNLQPLTVTAVTGPAPNSADSIGFCLFGIGVAPFTRDTADPASDAAPPTANSCTVFALDPTPAAGPGGTDLWTVTIPAAQLGSNTIDWLSITEHQDDSSADTIVESGKGDCRGDNVSDTGDDCQLDGVQIMFNPSGEGTAPPPTTPPPTTPPPPPGGGGGCNKIVGNARDNVLNGTAVCDNMNGKAGDDLLRGKKGDDKIRGGGGTDIAKGGGGNDNCTAEKERSC